MTIYLAIVLTLLIIAAVTYIAGLTVEALTPGQSHRWLYAIVGAIWIICGIAATVASLLLIWSSVI